MIIIITVMAADMVYLVEQKHPVHSSTSCSWMRVLCSVAHNPLLLSYV